MEEQGHSRDGEAGPPAVEMVVLTGVSSLSLTIGNSLSPRSSLAAMTLIVSPNLSFISLLISSLIFFLFVSLLVISLNIFNTLSKVGIDVDT